ncbi:MAG: hypothetical protein A3I24_04540 [Candidatus Harrisonbacteria bacterium RIFCSPLOWO2_02_FULL_41_13b]|uniref:Aspartyl/glutamyl-tRNA(Asn/Gln) amidotransferase subunit C n=1 Tax=Candidatus Harrisonbacteria bacterium RIFCSPLOWO2_02_FULL_41_13b TaxID=1798409 RepID=A0A1G1ZPZ6_9BACT|nr:MAG: hypothetical protein A3J53_02770 [Candidatus Harrisonbacteria bacterium RIFCSPHIGHO2_02_FULL_40_20]OGY66758.1 MAG: hypothetical protein A3I24_04540 [Candidatus Harrisonbacteria bacterium RIFCSPLOWO2_02_FULL_41_13b]
MSEINKKSLEHLADLARLEINPKKEEKFIKDLQSILGHFQELQSLNTENVLPMTGGTQMKNVFREDDQKRDKTVETRNVVDAFPEREKGYLRIPPVFK